MDDNPFVKLGLQKEIVESLHRQGRLNEFLRTYYRSIQIYVHPDRGGDNNLATMVNAAYDEVQRRPANVEGWIRSMGNDHGNSEYLALIERLTAKVEELQGVEINYRSLQEKYAALLASRNGDGTKADVRTASPRAKKEHDFEEHIGRDVWAADPEVKRSRAKRVDADGGVRAETKKSARTTTTTEPIVIPDLISYGMDGKPAAKYTAYLDGKAVRKADGSYLINNQLSFEKYFASKKDGRRLPNASEWYAMIERLYDTKNPALEGIVCDLRESWLCTGTKINYTGNIIIHPGSDHINCAIPNGNHWLDEVIDDGEWKKVLRALFGPKDVERVPEVLEVVNGKRPYIWVPDATGRKSAPERAVWFDIATVRFGLDCLDDPVSGFGRARGVRREGA
ncbi:hypothetical protein HY494_02630 [Candidatus Woesearchaeota archaeon]|nr:hypothetical protein [Candidatus Woesearchaeota archaeon]